MATLLGAALACLTLLPRVTVDLTSPFDSSDLRSVKAKITNTNIVTLTDVGVSVGVCELATTGMPFVGKGCDTAQRTSIGRTEWFHHTLIMDEVYEVHIGDAITPAQNAKLVGADITIRVDFDPIYISLLRHTKSRRFVTRPTEGDKMEWDARPIDQN